MTAQKQAFGALCEERAAAFLQKKGHTIVARNLRIGRGEIDIISTIDGIVCFVEIKASVSLYFGPPVERVTLKKQRQIGKLARMYLQSNPSIALNYDPRFDVITIVANDDTKDARYHLEHIEDAFRQGDR